MAALDARIAALITAIGADVKDLISKQVIQASFYFPGELVAGTVGKSRFIVPPGNWTLVSVRGIIVTVNTGAAVVADVNKNGTTMYSTQGNRLSIPVSTSSVVTSTTPDVTSLTGGDVISADVDSVGSTVKGSDLSIAVLLKRA